MNVQLTLPGVPPAHENGASPKIAMINVAKGFGILLIVLGHNTIFSSEFSFLADVLAAFRIPFFFFMSGVTFSIARRTLRQIAVQRADAWLKPCAVVLIVIGSLKIALGIGTPEGLLLSLTFATGFTFAWPPLWFLPHLWLVYVFTAALLIKGQRLINTLRKRIFLLMCFGLGGYYLLNMFSSPVDNPSCTKQLIFTMRLFECGLPYSADLLLVTALYFLIGHFLSDAVKRFKPRGLEMLFSFVGLLVLCDQFPLSLDLNAREYQDLLISPFQAFFGIFTMLGICHYCAKSHIITKVIGYFGKTSLFILLFHAPVLYWILRNLPRWTDSPLLVGITAFVVPIALSLVAYYICRSNALLSMLMLPIRPKRVERRVSAISQ